MSRTIDEIESELLQLDRHARAALARRLLASLDALSEKEFDEVWIKEGEARYEGFKEGRTAAIDGDDVFARARSRER